MSLRSVFFAATVVSAALFAPSGGAIALPVVPRPAHVVIIVEENKSLAEIVGNGRAPFINALAKRGALFVHAHGVTHPSLPNYLALFAGQTNDNGDGCPATGIDAAAPNLGSELLGAHLTFAGFAEALPGTGSTVCAAGTYARKHAPWVAFSNIPKSASRSFDALPTSYDALPTVAFLIPDVDDDMHDGTIAEGDDWLASHLTRLARWADAHDTLVVLTWDEGYDRANTIPTIFYGPMVKPGRYSERIDHYNVLRTLENAYGLAPTGRAATVAPIVDCWRD
jgi:arylsulfatase A-like enzyme